MDLTTVLIGIGAGFATTLFHLISSIFARKKTEKNITASYEAINTRLTAMESKVDGVAKEVKDNGGNSLKDVTRATSEDVRSLRSYVSEQIDIQNANATIFMNESIQDPAFRLDKSGECTFANDRLVEFLGLPYKQITGRGFLKAIGQTQAERLQFQEQLMESIEGGVPFSYDVTVRTASGRSCPCEVKLQAYSSKSDPKAILFFYGKMKEKATA